MNLFSKINQPVAPDPLGMNECQRRAQPVEGALRCYNFMGGNSKASTASYDQRVAATEGSQVLQGNATNAADEAIVVRDNSKILSPGAVENYGTVTVQGVSEAAIQQALQTVNDITASANSVASAGQSELRKILSNTVDKLSEKESKEGEDARNKNILWLVLGVLALLGFVFGKFKRS